MTETVAKNCWRVINKLSEEALTLVINLAVEDPHGSKNFNQSKLSATMFLNAPSAIQSEAAQELGKGYDIFFSCFYL